MARRQMRLGVSMIGMGYHVAAWRHPDAPAGGSMELSHTVRVAQAAECGLFRVGYEAATLRGNSGAGPARRRTAPRSVERAAN